MKNIIENYNIYKEIEENTRKSQKAIENVFCSYANNKIAYKHNN